MTWDERPRHTLEQVKENAISRIRFEEENPRLTKEVGVIRIWKVKSNDMYWYSVGGLTHPEYSTVVFTYDRETKEWL